ncbi:hypothetical protein [Eubacterium callanderi]|uniref:hypothetical protein n=1 Tax=Eubacterium callanderi TaxID=53442 RepID=UPI00399A05EC
MKKLMTAILTFALIFNFTVQTACASAYKAGSVSVMTSTRDPGEGDSQPPTEPETPTEPEQPTEPETPTEPEQPTEPETPSQPEPPTQPENPDLPSTDPGDDSSGDDGYYDSYDNNDYTPSYRNSYDDSDDYVPTESTTVETTVEEQVQEVQKVEGDYPITLTVKETTIDVNLPSNVYTAATNQNTVTAAFNNDALNAAIAAGTAKLTEKQQAGSSALTKLVLKAPAIETKGLTDPEVNIHVPAPALKNMQTAKVTLNVPINRDSIIVSPSILKSDDLNRLTDGDKLVLGLKKGPSLSNSSYKLSETKLTPVTTPFTLEASTLKSTGALSALSAFEKPLEINIALTDDQASKLQTESQFTASKYNSGSDSVDPVVTTYHNDTKVATFNVNAPGNYLILLKTADKGINPLFIAVPIVIVLIGGGVFAFFKLKNRRKRNIFGDYDD